MNWIGMAPGTHRLRLPSSGWALPAALLACLLASVLGTPGVALGAQAPNSTTWTVSQGAVTVRARMTVGGGFDVTTSAIQGRLAGTGAGTAFEGQLEVDLSSLETGIGLRNRHLQANYLEVERGQGFDRAVLTGITLDRPLPRDAARHETDFSAELLLHGVTSAVRGEAEFRHANGRVSVVARFPLSLDEFLIPPPRYLGVGVRDAVEATVAFDAIANPSSASEAP